MDEIQEVIHRGCLKSARVWYFDTRGTWALSGSIIVDGYEVKIADGYGYETMEEAAKELKQRLVEAAKAFKIPTSAIDSQPQS